MNKYEVLYIINAKLDEATIEAEVEKFKDLTVANGGVVDSVDKWGSKKLAYAMDYKTEGYYVLMNFQSNQDFPRELERNMNIDEKILRYLVLNKN